MHIFLELHREITPSPFGEPVPLFRGRVGVRPDNADFKWLICIVTENTSLSV